jgi:hypothetical protein
MKHRSIGVFIILAAILAAAPQATRELKTLKSALGERVRSEILHAFLSLHSRDGASASAPQVRQLALASCDGLKERETQAAPRATRSEAQARAGARAEVAAPRRDAEELAMIIEPLPGIPTSNKAKAAHKINVEEFVELAEGPAEQFAESQLAMILPPDMAIPQASSAAARLKASEKTKAAEKALAARAERQAARARRDEERAAAFSFEDVARFSDAEWNRQVSETMRAAGEVRTNGRAPRFKFIKLKRPVRQGFAPPAWAAPRPEKQAAAPTPVSPVAPAAPAGE